MNLLTKSKKLRISPIFDWLLSDRCIVNTNNSNNKKMKSVNLKRQKKQISSFLLNKATAAQYQF